MALVRTDPFRGVDRWFQPLWAAQQNGPRSTAMPMDAYRQEDSFLLRLDLPGVTPESVELTVEDGVLTIAAERPAPLRSEGTKSVIAERPHGSFSRRVVLGKQIDSENIEANYEDGVLTVVIPVAEKAKTHRIPVTTGHQQRVNPAA